MKVSQNNVVLPNELTLNDGIYLVRLARRAIEAYVRDGIKIEPESNVDKKLMKKGMAFVTIDKIIGGSEKELRGCIGFLQPIAPLVKIVIESAIAAATQDPRFPPLKAEELNDIVIEVSVLSPPIHIKNPLKEVQIGKHGLIV